MSDPTFPLSASMMTSSQIRDMAPPVVDAHDPKHVPVLMSADNPNGWKIEDLAQQLIVEIRAKSDKIKSDPRLQAITVFNMNANIIAALHDIVHWQNNSLRALAALGPDQGPTGKPRIGSGSEA